MATHLPTVASDSLDGTRFDLVPPADPNARKWELQAGTKQDAEDWLAALRDAYTAAESAPR